MDVLLLPVVGAGFPSPAENFFEKRLDLAELLTPHPDFTYFTRVEGESMSGAGIHNGDILVVDRTLEAVNNSIVVAILNGGFVVKRIQFREHGILLISEHHRYPLITVTEQDTFSVWGVVTYAIHAVVGKHLTRGPVVPAQSPQSPPQRRLPQ